MIAIIYLHSNKESMLEKGEELGLTGDALNYFMYTCSEVKIELQVDREGHAVINKVNGRNVL